ncbi:MAG: Zn-ribbon domain-containing OB-fold protein [Panacagrimonas sp.]
MSGGSKRRPGETMGGAFVADPRPAVRGERVIGVRCSACGYPTSPPAPWCPACQSLELFPVEFGPGGVVWSSTLIHIPVGRWKPPYALAYVDLDQGPRVLAHLLTPIKQRAGTRVRIVGGDDGDLIVTTELAPEPAHG